MTHAERLLWLAEREIPCSCLSCAACGPCNDELYVARTDGTTYKHSPGCQLCGGTKEVPEFPWLWRECERCTDTSLHPLPQGMVDSGSGKGGMWGDPFIEKCFSCRGRGWVPRLDIPIEEALAAMPRVMRRTVLSRFYLSEAAFQGDTQEQIRLAFWQAVEKVVSKP